MILRSELRIGNIVIDGEDGLAMTITIGEQIDHSDMMNPVPLNEEWLKKLSFEKIDNRNLFGWYKGINKSCSLCWGFGKDVSIDNEDGDVMLDYIPCEYVHQLQNLYFALTGTELKIIP